MKCSKAECMWNINGNECRKPDLEEGTFKCVNGKLVDNEGANNVNPALINKMGYHALFLRKPSHEWIKEGVINE